MRALNKRWRVVLALVVLAAASGCVSAPDDLESTSCRVHGAVQACGETWSNTGRTLTCYEGTRSCDHGKWSECSNGKVVQHDLSAGASQRLTALSTPQNCLTNPCNPDCQTYIEIPDGGLRPIMVGDGSVIVVVDGGGIVDGATGDATYVDYDWTQGSFNEYPPDTIEGAQNEPCSIAGDCQMGTYCSNPTMGSCSHHPCSSGGELEYGCTDCVAAVCDYDSPCCSQSSLPVAPCSHDPCTTGASLATNCGSCVALVCASDSSCCTDT